VTEHAKTSAAATDQGAVAAAGTTIVLGLPWETPPLSLNDRHANRIVESKAIAKVRRDAGWVAKSARLGSYNRVRVALHYCPLRRGRRDADNLVGTLKPVCDGLVDAGLVPDDTPEHMAKDMPVIHESDGIRRNLWLTIQILEAR
jgi:crossover junction endodeoxyribonuclease RusA